MLFLENVSPALELVDSSSGAIGTAVNHAIEACAKFIAERRHPGRAAAVHGGRQDASKDLFTLFDDTLDRLLAAAGSAR